MQIERKKTNVELLLIFVKSEYFLTQKGIFRIIIIIIMIILHQFQ